MAHLLISQDYLNKKSLIPSNVEWEMLLPHLELAQMMDLMPLLGSDFYDEIITQSTPPTSFTSLNKTLLDTYILPALTYFFLARATPFIRARYTNKGVMLNNADNSNNTDLSETKYLVDIHKNTAEDIANRMIKYIELKGSAYFPTYFTSNNQTLIPPANDAFDSPLYLEDLNNVKPYPNWGDIR